MQTNEVPCEFTDVMTQLLEHMEKVHSLPPVQQTPPEATITEQQYQEHCTLQQLSAMIESSLGPLPQDHQLGTVVHDQLATMNTAPGFNLSELNINSIQYGSLPEYSQDGNSCPVIIVNVQPQFYDPTFQTGFDNAQFSGMLTNTQPICTASPQDSGRARRNQKRRRSVEQGDYDKDSKRSKYNNNDNSFNVASEPPGTKEEDEEFFTKLINMGGEHESLTPSVFLTPSCFAYSNAQCQQQLQLLEDMTPTFTPNTDFKLFEYLIGNQSTATSS